MTTVRRRVFRTGLQTLEHDDDRDRWYVAITNRAYRSRVEVPAANVPKWLAYFDQPATRSPGRGIQPGLAG